MVSFQQQQVLALVWTAVGVGQGHSCVQLSPFCNVPGYCAAWGKALQDFLGDDEFGFSILYKAGMRPCSAAGKQWRQCLCWLHGVG